MSVVKQEEIDAWYNAAKLLMESPELTPAQKKLVALIVSKIMLDLTPILQKIYKKIQDIEDLLNSSYKTTESTSRSGLSEQDT